MLTFAKNGIFKKVLVHTRSYQHEWFSEECLYTRSPLTSKEMERKLLAEHGKAGSSHAVVRVLRSLVDDVLFQNIL